MSNICPTCKRSLSPRQDRLAARKFEREAARKLGKIAVIRHGKMHYRAFAGAPIDELTPAGQAQRLKDDAIKAQLLKP